MVLKQGFKIQCIGLLTFFLCLEYVVFQDTVTRSLIPAMEGHCHCVPVTVYLYFCFTNFNLFHEVWNKQYVYQCSPQLSLSAWSYLPQPICITVLPISSNTFLGSDSCWVELWPNWPYMPAPNVNAPPSCTEKVGEISIYKSDAHVHLFISKF